MILGDDISDDDIGRQGTKCWMVAILDDNKDDE